MGVKTTLAKSLFGAVWGRLANLREGLDLTARREFWPPGVGKLLQARTH